MVKNLLSNGGNVSSIHVWGTKIPHAMGQLSPSITNYGEAWALPQRTYRSQLRPDTTTTKKTTHLEGEKKRPFAIKFNLAA